MFKLNHETCCVLPCYVKYCLLLRLHVCLVPSHVSSADQERLDYVEDYQDLYTSSETFDVEVFSIPSEGLFMAAANRYWDRPDERTQPDCLTTLQTTQSLLHLHGNPHLSSCRDSRPGSGVYKWRDGSFQLYQNISTQEARAWKHFTIDDKVRAASSHLQSNIWTITMTENISLQPVKESSMAMSNEKMTDWMRRTNDLMTECEVSFNYLHVAAKANHPLNERRKQECSANANANAKGTESGSEFIMRAVCTRAGGENRGCLELPFTPCVTIRASSQEGDVKQRWWIEMTHVHQLKWLTLMLLTSFHSK